MSYVLGLKCRECGREYPKDVLFVCEYCFGSLEVNYDYKAIKKNLTKETLLGVPKICGAIRSSCPLIKTRQSG